MELHRTNFSYLLCQKACLGPENLSGVVLLVIGPSGAAAQKGGKGGNAFIKKGGKVLMQILRLGRGENAKTRKGKRGYAKGF